MNFLKLAFATTLAVVTVGIPQLTHSQNTVTDSHGTTFLMDVLPPVQNVPTSALAVTKKGRVTENPLYTGLDFGGNADEKLLVNRLLGVVLVKTPSDVRPGGWRGVEGVWHDFKDFPPEVGWVLQKYLCKPVSLKSLDEMIKDVTLAYHEADRAVIDVLFPEQNISCGVVQLVVVESTLARVRVEDMDVATEEYIQSQLRVRKGKVIRSSEVIRDLAWINRSYKPVEHRYSPGLEYGTSDLVLSPENRLEEPAEPTQIRNSEIFHDLTWPNSSTYRDIDFSYAPGSSFGTSDMILKTLSPKKSSAFVGYDNYGIKGLGRERFSAGFNLNDLGRPGRSLSYQYMSDFRFDNVIANTVAYSQDLPWRHNLSLLASFVDIDANNTQGFNWQLSGRYNIPLCAKETYLCEPLFGTIHRSRQLHFGFDFKTTESDLEFGERQFAEVLTNNPGPEIYQFTAGYKEVWQHPGGVSLFDINGYASPGGFSNHNSDRVFNLARTGAESTYGYATASFEHQHDLMQDWSMRFKTAGQISNQNLISSEQMGAGGFDIVRGFDQRVIRGDEGIWTTFELYAPDMSLGRTFDWPSAHGPCVDQLRLLGFVDAAAVSNKNLQAGESESQSLASVGVGMRWTYNDFFKLRVDYGHPVKADTDLPVDTSGRFHIGATATF